MKEKKVECPKISRSRALRLFMSLELDGDSGCLCRIVRVWGFAFAIYWSFCCSAKQQNSISTIYNVICSFCKMWILLFQHFLFLHHFFFFASFFCVYVRPYDKLCWAIHSTLLPSHSPFIFAIGHFYFTVCRTISISPAMLLLGVPFVGYLCLNVCLSLKSTWHISNTPGPGTQFPFFFPFCSLFETIKTKFMVAQDTPSASIRSILSTLYPQSFVLKRGQKAKSQIKFLFEIVALTGTNIILNWFFMNFRTIW